MNLDPEEPDLLGPIWAHVTPKDEEYLRALHHDYVRVSHVEKWSKRGYLPTSRIAEDEENKLVAWTSVSPSQIESYQRCKRLWFFKSIMRLPELQKGNQALGEGVHLILEMSDRVEKGTIPRRGYEYNHSDVATLDQEGWTKAEALASLMVPYVPRSRPGLPVLRESKITLDTYEGGPTMIGYMDLGVPPGIGWPELMIPDTASIIGDYKTLSDFKYMKSPEELAGSVQMMTYAKWAIEDIGPNPLAGELIEASRDTREVYLVHLYGRTKPPFTKNSVRHSAACVTVDQINAKWEKTLDIVRSMDHSAMASDAQDVEATGVYNDHCSAFGGCAYRDRCGLNQGNPISNLFSIRKSVSSSPTETPDMSNVAGGSLLAKIAAARAKAAGLPEPTEPAPQGNPPGVPSAPQSEPAPPSEPVKSKGPVSTLVGEIRAAHGGSYPMLSGLIALMYAKEQELDFKPGAGLSGAGSLKDTNCKTMADLVALKAKAPVQAAPSVSTGILSPDAPPREQAVITKPGDGVDPIKANAAVTATDAEPETEGEDEPEAGAAEAPQDAQNAPQGSTPAPTGAKRGRRSNAEIAAEKAKAEAELEAEIMRRVAERVGYGSVDLDAQKVIEQLTSERDRARAERSALEAKVNASQRVSGPAPSAGFVLFVDCYPVKGLPEGTVDYLEWYAPIAAGAADASKVDDWRLIQYTSKGVLATAMRLVVANGDLPSAMTISTSAPGYDVAMEVLSPLAKTIIRRM